MNFIENNIICPSCNKELASVNKKIICNYCDLLFPTIKEKIVLVSKENQLFPLSDYSENHYNKKITPQNKNFFKNFIPSPSVNLSQKRVLKKLLKSLSSIKQDYKILVLGCANQKNKLNKIFKKNNSLILSDISLNSDCNIIFDIHNIPFKSNTFDAVITTAVLEHVYNPEEAVNEIFRVLKKDGVVYSEMPFIQQVHEGAYDFTRLSMVGHHKLFKKFENIEDGIVAGPATALYWSIENLLIAFSSSIVVRNTMKAISRLFFSWVKYLDYIICLNRKSLDGASCTYILAKKSNKIRTALEVIDCYEN